ncbi:uncharacterized protein VTP21DRAFT_5035 [Calcarisporiella thermophila]|uniref:uncharacterized protein n=1 Tax=Calcarisporiella thermophila TaxID=911321 RepID=UPI003743B4E6
MAPQATIRIYYDVVSPFSYFCFNQLLRYEQIWTNVVFEKIPFFLGGIMQGSGNQPPATIPAKANYMMKYDIKHYTEMYKLPYSTPSIFPAQTLLPMRVLTALKMQKDEEGLLQATKSLFNAYFTKDADIGTPEVVEECIAFLGKDRASKLMQAAQSAEVKSQLKKVTDEALKKGAFGSPTMWVSKAGEEHEEMFFGCDRLEHIAYYLDLPYLSFCQTLRPKL